MIVLRFNDLGEYLTRIHTTEEALQFEDETRIYIGEANLTDQYHDLVTNLPVDKPAKPSPHHKFNYTTKQWQDPRTLADLKTAKWIEIKQARDAAIAEPLPTPFGVFDADLGSSAKISQAVLLANNLTALGMAVAIDFTLADNTVARLDAAKMVQVGLALAGREQAVRAKATLLRAQIEAATTKAAVEAVVWA